MNRLIHNNVISIHSAIASGDQKQKLLADAVSISIHSAIASGDVNEP